MKTVGEWLRKVVGVRRDELVPAGLLALYGYLALTSFYVVKPVRNSVFVDRVGADSLPVVYVITAVFVTAVMVVYSRVVDRLDRKALLLGTFGVLAGSLVGFWWILRGGSTVMGSGAFYIWGKLYPLLLVSQFWLVGNLLFTTRQAKRLFGPVGVGLILGGLSGSVISGTAVSTVGSENLLLVATGILLLCALIVRQLFPHIEEREDASGRLVGDISGDALQLLRDSSHLRAIAWILGLTIVVGALIDWQFNEAVDLFVPGEDQKTAFYGRFFVILNLVSVAVQIFLTGLVLRKLGIGVALLTLPVALLLGSVAIFAVPALLTASVLKGGEGALRYSLDQSTRELLYLPVPTELKYRAKPLIDLAIYRGGTGVGGLLLMVFVNLLGLGIREVSVLSVLLIGLWVYFAVEMRKEFRDSVRRLIGVRDVKLEELIFHRLDAGTVEELQGTLRDGSEKEILFALSLLEHNPPPELEDEFRNLLGHESEGIRQRAVGLLSDLQAGDHLDEITSLLDDASLHVQTEAIHYVCEFGSTDAAEQMEAFLRDTNEQVRTAAVGCLLRHGGNAQIQEGLELIRRMADDEQPEVRRRAAELLGELREPVDPAPRLLSRLLRDREAPVRHAALRAAGRCKAARTAPRLVEALARPGERATAFEALHSLGDAVHGLAASRLLDQGQALEVRRLMPALLMNEATDGSVGALLAAAEELEEPTLRYQALRALNKIRRERYDLDFGDHDPEPIVRREAREGYRWCVIAADLEPARATPSGSEGVDGSSPGERAAESVRASDLLWRTVEQRRLEAVERALRALGLRYSQEDLEAAYAGLAAEDEITQQRGFELLENLLSFRFRRLLAGLVDPERDTGSRAEEATSRFEFPRRTPAETLERLARGVDYWAALLACRDLGRPLPAAGVESGDSLDALEARLQADTPLSRRRIRRELKGDVMRIVERAEFLSRTALFEDLRTEDLAGIAALMGESEFDRGEQIFPEGAPGGRLHVVVRGRIRAARGDRTLFRADPGEAVGGLSLVDARPTDYEATAVEPTRTLTLDREEFFELLEERFRLVRGVLSYLSGVIRHLNEELEEESPAIA